MKTYATTTLSEKEIGVMNLDEELSRGIAASEAGDKPAAEAIFRQIVASNPDALEAWVWLGWTSVNLDDSEAAFTRASTLAPDNEEAKLGLRWVASQRGDAPPAEVEPQQNEVAQGVAEVEQPVTRTVVTLPENWTYEDAMKMAVTHAQSGDKPTAYSIFWQIAERYPDSVQVWVWCGGTSPSLDEAEHAFRHAQQLDPGNEEANLGLRWVALRRRAARHTGDLVAQPQPQALTTATGSTGTLTTTGPMPQAETTGTSAAVEESGPSTTKKAAKVKPAKELSFFARLLKKLNIPIPVLLLICAVIVVWAIVAAVYLQS